MSAPPRAPASLVLLATTASVALLALRLHVATGTGFGDSEALYVSYALHPQPAYLDHPGLIGSFARLLGRGAAPSAQVAHLASAVLATLIPWLGALAARLTGASPGGALRTALALTLVPELAVGLFGLTPDLLLCTFWLAAIALAGLALRSPARSFSALVATLGVGVLVGLAFLSKVSGALLGLSLLTVLALRSERARLATLGPWGALAVAAVLSAPVVLWEARHGFPMLYHRLVSTQGGAGLSWRNLGALVGGQLAYVTPPFLFAVGLLAVDLWRRRREDSALSMLWLLCVVPAVPLVVLCLWSRVAEPHWLAPAYLALAVFLGRSSAIGPRLARGSLVTGAVVVCFAWLWVRTPAAILLLGESYRPRYDLANDLYAWGPGGRMLERAVGRATLDSRRLPVVVGPHWIVCAQAQATLGLRVAVGCNSPRADDFDRWVPRKDWLNAPSILFVHDSRFAIDPERELPGRIVRSVTAVDIRRGGQVVRTIWATHLEKLSDVADRDSGERR